MCYQMAACTNAQRCQLIMADLQSVGLLVEQMPVPGEMLPNLFVRLGPDGPLLLLIAHYDKSRETPTYQAASDNTAAVVVLLAALHSLVAGGTAIKQPIGVLFTSAEERGLLGAMAFVEHAQQQQIAIAAAFNFDMLGRERLAIRPSALPGFYVELPLFGWFAYDGRHIRRGNAYPQPDAHLVAQIKRVTGDDLVIYRRFTAASDSNVFQDFGIPTVSISSADMFYLDTIWERDSDRIELLDQRHLERAHQMICQLVASL
jgi:Zn-dependent M28 family amino/carboxypeptidase